MAIDESIKKEIPTFLECLHLIDEFDKLFSKQKLPPKFDTLRDDLKEKIKANVEKHKKEAQDKENQLISKLNPGSEELNLFIDIIKNLKIRHGLLESHDQKPEANSKYGSHFNQKLYYEILPYCQLAYLYEQNGDAEEHAEKLSVLFNSVKDILAYFEIQASINKETNDNLVHDACLFELRDLASISQESWHKWKTLVSNDKGNIAFIMEILPNAKVIEDLVDKHYSKDKKLIEIQKSTAELIHNIAEKNKEVKSLSSRASELDEDEEKQLETARQELSDLKVALFEACKGLPLKDYNISYLTAFNQKILSDLGAFSYLVSKIGEQNYYRFKKFKYNREAKYREHDCAQNNDYYIPNITIDGKDLDPPIEGFYLMKVDVQDELQAARAACLGKLTSCCQSVGEAGDSCTEHGLTSPYGGFYVICKGDINNPKIDHYLLGQCWAWRSKNDAIVFDSIEVADKYNDFHKSTARAFFNKLAVKMIENQFTDKVVCGGRSGISKHIGFDASLNRMEYFRDYNGYCDSQIQRVLQDKNAPYYFYLTNDECKQKTILLAEEAMKAQTPLVNSDYMAQLLNFIALEIFNRSNIKYSQVGLDVGEEEQNEILLQNALSMRDEVLTVSEKNNRKQDVLDVLNAIQQFLNLGDDNIDLIIENIKNKKFPTKTINHRNESILLALLKKEPMTVKLKEDIIYLIDTLGKDVIILPDNDGVTPFMRAAQLKDLSLCHKLVKSGCSASELDRFGRNALFNVYEFIINRKYFEIEDLKFLLQFIAEFGISINSVDSNGETLLMKLSKTNDGSLLECLVNAGARSDIKDDYNNTALVHAINHRQEKSCFFLINTFQNLVNIPNDNGDTPLHLAIQNRMTKVFLALINKGANINVPNNSGITPLDLACDTTDFITLMAKEKIHFQDKKGNTALHTTIQEKMLDVSLELINSEVDLNLQNSEGDTPLNLAVKNRAFDVCLALVDKGVDVNIGDRNGYTPLMNLINARYFNLNHSLELVLALIKHKADVNVVANNGCTLLHLAILSGKVELFKMLIEHGADSNALNNEGESPLHLAIRGGNVEIFKMLVNCGANINAESNEGETPLHLAIRGGNEEIFKMLIEYGANINAQNNKGETPLHLAIGNSNSSVFIETLIKEGADVNAQNKKGSTPLDLSIIYSYPHKAQILLKSGAQFGDDTFYLALKKSMPSVCLELMRCGANTDAPEHSEETSVELAIKNCINSVDPFRSMYIEVISELVDKNKENLAFLSTTRIGSGMSLLQHFVHNTSDTENCIAFIKKGVDVNVKDQEGSTLLHSAIQSRNIDICEALIQNGADVNCIDQDGNTPLHSAIMKNEEMFAAQIYLRNWSQNWKGLQEKFSYVKEKEFYEKILTPDNEIMISIVSMLIKSKAGINVRNISGKAPIDLAIENNYPGVFKLLVDNGAHVDSDALRLAKEKGFDVESLEMHIDFTGQGIKRKRELHGEKLKSYHVRDHIAGSSSEGSDFYKVLDNLRKLINDLHKDRPVSKSYISSRKKMFDPVEKLYDYISSINFDKASTQQEILQDIRQHALKLRSMDLPISNEKLCVFVEEFDLISKTLEKNLVNSKSKSQFKKR